MSFYSAISRALMVDIGDDLEFWPSLQDQYVIGTIIGAHCHLLSLY